MIKSFEHRIQMTNEIDANDGVMPIMFIVYRPEYFPAPSGQNFLIQKIVADPKMRCHQKSFGIWRVTEATLVKKTIFFPKKKKYFEKNS